MKTIEVENKKYALIKNYRDAFIEEDFKKRYTDYFASYDYILGDYAYGTLRLKGFNKKENPNFKATNDYEQVNTYLKEYCAYECRYFILELEKD